LVSSGISLSKILNEPKKISNWKKIGQLYWAHMPERASRFMYG
jgi:hypothetical protein